MSNEDLAVLYQGGDREVLYPLWVQVEKLATMMVRPYAGLAYKNRAVDFDDLLQSAFLAVESAARAYRPDGGLFTTIMGFYIKAEMAALLGLRGRVRKEHYEAVSTSAPMGDDGTATVGDTIADENLPDPDDALFREDIQREVRAAVDALPALPALAIRLYYFENMTLAATGEQMGGVSMERARQHRVRGENRLRRNSRLRKLADDVLGAPYRHVGVAAFHRDWTSTVERAVTTREWLREKAIRWGVSEAIMREWGL